MSIGVAEYQLLRDLPDTLAPTPAKYCRDRGVAGLGI